MNTPTIFVELPMNDTSVRADLHDFCRRHHIRRLAVFGSVLRGEARPDSDLDLLVEFHPGHTPGFEFVTIEDELSELLGRKVDLNTYGSLSRYFRDDVLAHAEVIYAEPPIVSLHQLMTDEVIDTGLGVGGAFSAFVGHAGLSGIVPCTRKMDRGRAAMTP